MLYGVGDSGTDEKTGGGDGGDRVEDVTIFIRSDKHGSYTLISKEFKHFQGHNQTFSSTFSSTLTVTTLFPEMTLKCK